MGAGIIAVTIPKGGTGKSTTAHALAAGLSLRGFRTLAIDLDPQGNLTYTMGANPKGATVLEVLKGEAKAKDAIQRTPSGDVIAASLALAGADTFIVKTGKEFRLKEALEPIAGSYDFIVLDTPPALGILTVNALTACRSVIIPAQADIYSLNGIDQLTETLEPVKKYCNAGLTIAGVLLTRYSPRSILSREVAEMAEEKANELGTKLYKATIREAIAIKEAQISRKSIFEYAPSSNGAKDYNAFVEEFLKDEAERS